MCGCAGVRVRRQSSSESSMKIGRVTASADAQSGREETSLRSYTREERMGGLRKVLSFWCVDTALTLEA